MEFRHLKTFINIPLFKYYGNILYAKDAIENRRIHLETPSKYNDIYDSSFTIQDAYLNCMHLNALFDSPSIKTYLISLSESELATIKEQNLSINATIEYLCNRDRNINKKELKNKVISLLTDQKNILHTDTHKISCFSENNTSLLMWAYYANNYSGVCIRFNAHSDDILSKHCQKVQYTNHYLSDNSFNNYFRKSIEWSHEQEWRIVCETKDEYIPTNSIDAVFLGARMDEPTIQEFIDLGNQHNLEVYKMTISNTKYEILFEQVL